MRNPPHPADSMTISYPEIKQLHVCAAAVSLALFALRGVWMMASSARLHDRWARIVPHVVDTLLLGSAVWLAWHLGADGTRGWLVAKVVALFVYIALGIFALRRGRTRGVRVCALIAALATFGYIVSVAVTKTSLGFVTWL